MRFLVAGVAAALLSVTVLARELALQVQILAPRVVAWAQQEEANAMARGNPQYWDVTYNFRGQERYAQLTHPPGQTIPVNEAGEPRG